MNKLARVVEGFCKNEELPHLDKGGMARVIEFASRLADDQTKLSTRLVKLLKLLEKQPLLQN